MLGGITELPAKQLFIVNLDTNFIELAKLVIIPTYNEKENIEAIIAAAQYVGADAIHPGYGFLSEQPSFVMAVEAAGLVFIGPRAETMERLGSKSGAKIEAAKLGLPILLGSENAMKNSAED